MAWGSKPTRGPNANDFASQWNIGLTKQRCQFPDLSLISEFLRINDNGS